MIQIFEVIGGNNGVHEEKAKLGCALGNAAELLQQIEDLLDNFVSGIRHLRLACREHYRI